ncbi:hypothetical protein HOE67_04145 [Candidatus Peregrinibacteria bacterium]|jgi:hypothetical protein|nr:hypothetical protein [Candidatus Peregrinibacteria bacterium]MBT4056275.1 hypothetical protein [Candidatus Peregrinibacteria bacterium]
MAMTHRDELEAMSESGVIVDPTSDIDKLSEEDVVGIEAFLDFVRATVDDLIRQDLKPQIVHTSDLPEDIMGHEFQDPRLYPYNYCQTIVSRVWYYVMDIVGELYGSFINRPDLDPKIIHGIVAVKRLINSETGVFKQIEIETRGKFHNGLQVGAYWADVSPDALELDAERSPIQLSHVLESGIRQIETYAQVARIMRSHHQVEVYKNDVVPAYAPLFPFVTVGKGIRGSDSMPKFSTTTGPLMARDSLSDFLMVEQFLTDVGERRVGAGQMISGTPGEIGDRLRGALSFVSEKSLDHALALFRRKVKTDDSMAAFREYSELIGGMCGGANEGIRKQVLRSIGVDA